MNENAPSDAKRNQNDDKLVVPPSDGGFWKTSWQFVSQRIFKLATFAALVSIAGFFVVHSYLAKVTQVFTYAIDPVVYIAAGINVLIGIPITVILMLFPSLLTALIGIAILVLLVWLGARIVKTNPGLYTALKNKLGGNFAKRLARILNWLLTLNNILAVAGLLLLIFIVGYGYGQVFYEHIPRYLGGGMPSNVILIFKQPELIPTLGLPFSINHTYPGQSEPVELIMELSNGVLVRQPQNQIPVIVDGDLLYGIIDAAPPVAPTQTPIQTPTTPAATTP